MLTSKVIYILVMICIQLLSITIPCTLIMCRQLIECYSYSDYKRQLLADYCNAVSLLCSSSLHVNDSYRVWAK